MRKLFDNYELLNKEIYIEENKKIINIININKDILSKYLKNGAIKQGLNESLGLYADLVLFFKKEKCR